MPFSKPTMTIIALSLMKGSVVLATTIPFSTCISPRKPNAQTFVFSVENSIPAFLTVRMMDLGDEPRLRATNMWLNPSMSSCPLTRPVSR